MWYRLCENQDIESVVDPTTYNIIYSHDFKVGDDIYSEYNINGDYRLGHFTILKDKNGYIVRNALIADKLQKQGIGTKIYKEFNLESIAKTGKPLQSTKPRVLESNNQQIHELSDAAKGLWNKFVAQGKAIKNKDGSYSMVKEPWQMTRKEFLGKPRITPNSNASLLKPYLGKSASEIEPEPFMHGKYTIKRGTGDYSTSTVMDGDKPIACYDGDVLVVDKNYRRQGIGSELVYDFRTRNPHVPPTDARTKIAQEIQSKVHRRIVLEAIMNGLSVPKEVLKDYPDLVYRMKFN